MITQGKTGDYIRSLMRQRATTAALYGAAALALAFITFKMDLTTIFAGGPKSIIMIAMLLTAAYCVSQAKKNADNYSRASIGLKSEQRVAKALKNSGAYAVVHGALLADKGGDADHIVIGPSCIVIETKTGKGKIQVTPDSFIVGSRRVPGHPVKQAKRQAATLGRKLGVRASAIVCVVDMVGAPIRYDDVWICSVNDLNRVISNAPAVMTPAKASEALQRLR